MTASSPAASPDSTASQDSAAGAVHVGTIVVGVDGSEPGDAALAWAAEQASLEGRRLTLVHGIGYSGLAWGGGYGYDQSTLIEALSSDGRDILTRCQATVERDHPGLEVEVELARVDPRTALLHHAETATMLVVGSRGRGPVASLVLGSVSAAVSRHAACPVVVIRPRDTERLRLGVLVGVDGDGTSSAALEFAYRQASTRGLPLTVMHCFVDPGHDQRSQSVIPYDTPGLEDQRLVLDESVAGLGEKFPDVTVSLVLSRGLPDTCLVTAAADMDLVVVGADTGRGLLGLVLDPRVDRYVVEHAATVVAVVPEPASQAPGHPC
ncbi:universal stress protein [soil metagenome]